MRDSIGTTWECAPGCDYLVTSYHARRGGRTLCRPTEEKDEMEDILDEYDRGEPQRDQRRLTVRWKADGRNVMTDDGPEEKALHIATFASPTVAQHIVELHLRTLGEGQEPPPSYPRPKGAYWDCGVVHGTERHTHITEEGAQRCVAEQAPAKLANQAVLDEFLDAQADGTVNVPRATLPQDLQLARHYGPPGTARVEVSIRNGVERLLAELVNRRVAEWLAGHPPVMRVELGDGMPSETLMVLTLRGRGYQVSRRPE